MCLSGHDKATYTFILDLGIKGLVLSSFTQKSALTPLLIWLTMGFFFSLSCWPEALANHELILASQVCYLDLQIHIGDPTLETVRW